MKFSFEKIVEVPVEFLFQDVSNFDNAVTAAKRRGIDVRRTDRLKVPAAGMSWDVTAKIRHRPRNFTVNMINYDDLEGYILNIISGIFTTKTTVDCIALARARSRLAISFELSPLNLRGRLLIQSLKLARGRISSRTENAIAKYAKNVEERYAAAP